MRKTQEQYITEVQLLHNFKYSYGNTVYKGAGPKDKIIVTCHEHGITNNNVAARRARVSKSAGRVFKAVFTIKSESGEYIYRLEQRVLKWLRGNYGPVQEKFEGSTECFSKVNLEDLINYIAPSAEEVFWL